MIGAVRAEAHSPPPRGRQDGGTGRCDSARGERMEHVALPSGNPW